jgi:IS30 family transposase
VAEEGSFPLRQNAREVGRAVSIISRELQRNARPQRRLRFALGATVERSSPARGQQPSTHGEATWLQLEDRLREDWSPEQIADPRETVVCRERIQRMANDRRLGGTLW